VERSCPKNQTKDKEKDPTAANRKGAVHVDSKM